MSSSLQPRIAIVGGGPAGLTLGLLLHRRNILFTIFEMRQKPTDDEMDSPSGMLDLHEESGIAAIQECGLHEEFLKLTGECTQADKVSDRDGKILHAGEGEYSERPEISRHALTKLLISHLPKDRIQWSHKVFSARSFNSSDFAEIELDFGTNGKHTFDLVIGADGAWSRVRNLLSDVKPRYEGRQNITLTIRNVTTRYPHLSRLVGLGSFSALGDRHGVMSQRGSQDSARIYIFLTTDDEHFASTSGIADQPAINIKKKLLEDASLLGTWGPTLKELVTVACDEESADNLGATVDIRPMYFLPVGFTWNHRTGVTVIGDAAHLMGPWAGEGVNLAMWDSLLLANTIVKAHRITNQENVPFQKAADPLLKDFIANMAARAKEKAEESVSNGEMLFAENGAEAFTQFIRNAG